MADIITCRQCHLPKGVKGMDIYPERWLRIQYDNGAVDSHFCSCGCLFDYVFKVEQQMRQKIPAQPEYNCPPGGIKLPPEPPTTDAERIPLVAFYT